MVVLFVTGAFQTLTQADNQCSRSSTKKPYTGIGLYGGALESEQEIIDSVAKYKANGVGCLFPSLSGGGTVIWKTDKADYYPSMQEKFEAGYDGLAVLIKHAHAAGIKVYPSVAVCPGGRMLSENPRWETRDRKGQPSSATTGAAVSLAYPGARKQKIAILMDLVTGYDIDGILLDYCRYPENSKKPEYRYGWYGYDKPLIDACKNIYGFDPRKEKIDSPKWNIFNQMRAETVNSFVAEFKEAVQRSGRKIRIGGFGDTDPDKEAHSCGRDYTAWAHRGLIDDFLLATYTTPVKDMKNVVARAREAIGDKTVLLSALCPFNNFIKTNEEMIAAGTAQLVGGADGLWIYREDYLIKLDLWDGAKAAGQLSK